MVLLVQFNWIERGEERERETIKIDLFNIFERCNRISMYGVHSIVITLIIKLRHQSVFSVNWVRISYFLFGYCNSLKKSPI